MLGKFLKAADSQLPERLPCLNRNLLIILGIKYACAVNSCTAALHLGIEALGVKPGEKVFVKSMTFTATAEVIR